MSAPVSLPAGVSEILQLFSGRRRGRRSACEWKIECRGPLRTFGGQAVDISRVGTLLSLSRPRFFEAGRQGLFAVVERLQSAFPRGMVVTFAEPRVTVKASIARVTQDPTTGQVLLGCQFRRPLTPDQCSRLGVAVDEGASN